MAVQYRRSSLELLPSLPGRANRAGSDVKIPELEQVLAAGAAPLLASTVTLVFLRGTKSAGSWPRLMGCQNHAPTAKMPWRLITARNTADAASA